MNQTEWFIERLTGDKDTVMDWRVIHDTDKGEMGRNLRGSYSQCRDALESYNAQGWGVHCAVNSLDGQECKLDNVTAMRANFADLDNIFTSHAMYEQAVAEGACIAVQSSPNKFHVYWLTQPYTDNERFSTMQRKLIQSYDGDKQRVSANCTMRVPGFYHCKGSPIMVTGWDLPSVDNRYTIESMEQGYQHVNVIEHVGMRKPLGDPDLQATSLEWLLFALNLTDPNEMDRGEWVSFTAAYKQAGWNLASENVLYDHWNRWCNKYTDNNLGENIKLWDSITDSEVGWNTIRSRTPIKAYETFGSVPEVKPATTQTADSDSFGEILSESECKEYFKDCHFVVNQGKMVDRYGRFMNVNAFDAKYGGKQFIITSTGKLSDSAWKAATKSTLWTVPKVDHTRFLPVEEPFSVIKDALGREGLNVYMPAKIDAVQGDVSLWLDLIGRVLPDSNDQRLFLEYLAHCVKYPGEKIPYAPMLQSAEGVGKSIICEVMEHALGDMYVYSPKATELVSSGSTFNAWQRGKLLITVNEIKIDERRELIEVLKPMITDKRVEVQSKGVDQEMEDNPANWLFFSNYKDAIPINKDNRRYAIFYSALQSSADIQRAGMGKEYFDRLFKWLRHEKGLQAIAYWLLNYPIERGALPVRAPKTSSYTEALKISRSPMEIIISECIEDNVQGFIGGYVSSIAVLKRCKLAGIRNVNGESIRKCMATMGYIHAGRATRSYINEDVDNRADIYVIESCLPVEGYGQAQGYI